MINWYNLLMSACWILGCAIVISTLSYASWEASAQGQKFIHTLGQFHIQISLNLSGFLFCTGMAGISNITWQQILWIGLALGFLLQIGWGIYKK